MAGADSVLTPRGMDVVEMLSIRDLQSKDMLEWSHLFQHNMVG